MDAPYSTTLSELQVIEIRATPHAYGTDTAFARRFGVGSKTIELTRKGQRHAHVPMPGAEGWEDALARLRAAQAAGEMVSRGPRRRDVGNTRQRRTQTLKRDVTLADIDEVHAWHYLHKRAVWTETGCLERGSNKNSAGYTQVLITHAADQTQALYLAHRIAVLLRDGVLAQGAVIMHTCDNRLCIAPDHLQVGTPSENVQDMVAKGRQGKREGPAVRLTPDQVEAIRRAPRERGQIAQLAQKYGVHRQSISAIVNGHRHKTNP